MRRLQVLKFAGQEIQHNQLDEKMLVHMKGKEMRVYAVDNGGSYDLLLWDSTQQCVRTIKNALPHDFFNTFIMNPFHQKEGKKKVKMVGVKLWQIQKELNLPLSQALVVMLFSNGYRGYQMAQETYDKLKVDGVARYSVRQYIDMASVKDVANGFIPRKGCPASAVLTDICRETGLINGLAFSTLPAKLGAKFCHVLRTTSLETTNTTLAMNLNTGTNLLEVDYKNFVTSVVDQTCAIRSYQAVINPKSFKDVGNMVTDLYALSPNHLGGYDCPSVVNGYYSTVELFINHNKVEVKPIFKTHLVDTALQLIKNMDEHPSFLGTMYERSISWRSRESSAQLDLWAKTILSTFFLVNSISLIDNIMTYLGTVGEGEGRALEVIVNELFVDKLRALKELGEVQPSHPQSEELLGDLGAIVGMDVTTGNLAILRPFEYMGVRPVLRSMSSIQESKVLVETSQSSDMSSYSYSHRKKRRDAYKRIEKTLVNAPEYYDMLEWFSNIIEQVPTALSPIKKISKAVARYVGGKNVLKELLNPDSTIAHLTGFSGAITRGTSVDSTVTDFLFHNDMMGKVFSESMVQWWESADVKPLFLGDTTLNLYLRGTTARSLIRSLWDAPFTDGQRKRVLTYLVQDSVLRQRVRDPKSNYVDYLHAYSQLVSLGFRSWDRFDLEPYSLRLAHDIYTAEYEELKQGMEREVFLSNYQGLRDMKLSERVILDEYFLRLPEDEQDLKDEGKALSHCVGGYGSRIKRGECAIVFLRRLDDPDTSYITVELNKHTVHNELVYTLGHIEGDHGNRTPGARIKQALREVADEVRNSQSQFNKTGEYTSLATKKKKQKQEALAI